MPPIHRTGAAGDRFNPFVPGFAREPYGAYRRFREEDPVHLGAPPIPSMPRCYYLFRHEDVRRALSDDRMGRERVRDGGSRRGRPIALPSASTVIRRVARSMLLFADPPRHDRLRALVGRAFGPELHALAERRAREIAPRLLEEAFGHDGRADLVQDFAVPLPVLVMSEVLGVAGADRLRIKRWSADIVAITDLRSSRQQIERASRATAEVAEYLRDQIRARRRRPTNDLLGRMLTVEVGGDRLSEEEVLANGVLMLAAGHETTVGLIGNGIKALLDHPERAERLAAHPELTTRAVEEFLRFESPVQMTFRVAHEDVAFGGVMVHRGEAVAAVIGSANRDPEVFPDPDDLVLDRAPNPHLAFGDGRHRCLGSRVARLEAAAAFEALIPYLPRLSYDPHRTERTSNVLFRALASLPVTWAR